MTGSPLAQVYAVWLGKKAILSSLLLFHSALPFRLLLQQESSEGAAGQASSTADPAKSPASGGGTLPATSLSYPNCMFDIHWFAALFPGYSRKTISCQGKGQFGLTASQLCLLTAPSPYLPPGLDALVNIVRERAAGQETSSPLGHMQVAILQHDLPLAYDNQRGPTQLHPFKDVVFSCLQQPGMMVRRDTSTACPEGCLVPTYHC